MVGGSNPLTLIPHPPILFHTTSQFFKFKLRLQLHLFHLSIFSGRGRFLRAVRGVGINVQKLSITFSQLLTKERGLTPLFKTPWFSTAYRQVLNRASTLLFLCGYQQLPHHLKKKRITYIHSIFIRACLMLLILFVSIESCKTFPDCFLKMLQASHLF